MSQLTEVQYSHSASEYSQCAVLETQDGVQGKVWRGEGSLQSDLHAVGPGGMADCRM